MKRFPAIRGRVEPIRHSAIGVPDQCAREAQRAGAFHTRGDGAVGESGSPVDHIATVLTHRPQTTGATSLTWSDTVAAGTDRAMFVEVADDGLGAGVSGITYGGTALTDSGQRRLAITWLKSGAWLTPLWAPPTSSSAFTATTAAAAGAVTFNGVDQSTPTGTFAAQHRHKYDDVCHCCQRGRRYGN